MKINAFNYERKFNLGDYESETIGFAIHIEEDEDEKIDDLIDFAQKLAIKNSTPHKRRIQKAKAQQEERKKAEEVRAQNRKQQQKLADKIEEKNKGEL